MSIKVKVCPMPYDPASLFPAAVSNTADWQYSATLIKDSSQLRKGSHLPLFKHCRDQELETKTITVITLRLITLYLKSRIYTPSASLPVM